MSGLFARLVLVSVNTLTFYLFYSHKLISSWYKTVIGKPINSIFLIFGSKWNIKSGYTGNDADTDTVVTSEEILLGIFSQRRSSVQLTHWKEIADCHIRKAFLKKWIYTHTPLDARSLSPAIDAIMEIEQTNDPIDASNDITCRLRCLHKHENQPLSRMQSIDPMMGRGKLRVVKLSYSS